MVRTGCDLLGIGTQFHGSAGHAVGTGANALHKIVQGIGNLVEAVADLAQLITTGYRRAFAQIAVRQIRGGLLQHCH